MRLIVLICLSWCCVDAAAAPGRAQELFATRAAAAVQIRVVDRASGDKSSIGSGFQIGADGLLATNFHVVAEFAHTPRRFRLEYLDPRGEAVALELLDVDPIHDLALLRAPAPLAATLDLARGALSQGERIYSMGNPLDLAMTIIEGTYNGYVEAARYRKMLFSASLNPGMSGGPALNEAGEVIGVNVAHTGEQISFLVPVEFLAALVSRRTDARWQALSLGSRIAEALLADQDAYFSQLLSSPWATQPFGEFAVPGRLSATLRCWGGSSDRRELRFDHVYQECRTQDDIYVDEDLQTGTLQYAFHYFSSRELNSVQFYGLLAGNYGHGEHYNAGDKEQVGNFRCREDFVRGSGLDWRVSFCARRYKRYAGLFDLSVVMASTDLLQRGLVVRLGIDGISEARSREMLRRFIEVIEWTP
jgi:serine protease Do